MFSVTKNYPHGAGIKQWVEPLLEALASHIRVPLWVLAVPLPILIPACVPGRVVDGNGPKTWIPATHIGVGHSRLLASACPRPGCCSYLGWEWAISAAFLDALVESSENLAQLYDEMSALSQERLTLPGHNAGSPILFILDIFLLFDFDVLFARYKSWTILFISLLFKTGSLNQQPCGIPRTN